MEKRALFCDGTGRYVFPPEPLPGQTVILKFRTAAGDADEVLLTVDGGSYKMEKEKSVGRFDYYTISWKLDEELFRYSFKVCAGTETLYYNRCGVSDRDIPEYAFEIMPGFSTPDWAKGAVMYQIFTDRFYNGDVSNDVETGEYVYIGKPSVRVDNWDKYPAAEGFREFYGGDLKGVIEKLDYLQELGVEVIYFNPSFCVSVQS